jgi:hypothetical protein
MPPLLTHWFTTGQAGQLHAAGGGGDDVGAKAGPPHLAGSGGGDDAPDAGQTCASNGGGAAAAAGQPQVSNPDGGTGADSAAGRPHASDASGDADAGTGAGQPHTGSGNDVGAAARAAVTPAGMPARGSTWLTGQLLALFQAAPGAEDACLTSSGRAALLHLLMAVGGHGTVMKE